MKLLYLFYMLCSISLSHAYYDSPSQTFPTILGIHSIVFQIGSTIYSFEGDLRYPVTGQYNITTISIDAQKNLHTQIHALHPAGVECQYCAGFVLNDSFVVILGGFIPLPPVHSSNFSQNMGVLYYDPQINTITRPDDFKALPGSPLQRFYQNNVITPDNSSIYVFGGVGVYQNNSLDMPIMRLDLTTWTFSQLSNFTYLGGTATMLPSGVVVLAFGTKGFNARTNGTYYDTGSVFLFDTKTNTLSTQSISGTPPPPRGEATGVLGPDNECIYYFGGNDFEITMFTKGDPDHDYTFTRTFSDLIVLNTSSWTWYTPSVGGLSSPARFGAFSVLYDENTIIIGGGAMGNTFLQDISVLRNLPSSYQTIDSTNLQWFTNSYLDYYYDLSGEGLSTGGIAGVTIGVIVFVAITAFILWKFIPNFKRFMIYVQREVIWKPRSGEPFWAESWRLITRFVLFIAFIAFVVYAIYRTLESPNLVQLQYEYVDTMQIPDIRICTQTFNDTNAYPFTIQCQLMNGTDCSSYFHNLSSTVISPVFNGGTSKPSCQLFIPPVGLSFAENPGTYTTQFASSMLIKLFTNDTQQAVSVYVTYYSPGYDPNRKLYNLSPENEMMTEDDYQTWLGSESLLHLTPNTFGTNSYTFTTATYSLTNTVTLSNSRWNYIGFANQYDSKLSLEQHVGPLVQVPEFAVKEDQPILLLTVMPNDFFIITSTQTRATTIISAFAQAGGVFGLFIAIQTLLFGFRPDSPWGLVHRWSFGSFRRELGNRLTTQFNKLNTPVPIVNPVHDRFSLKPMGSNTFILESTPFNPNGGDEDSEVVRIRRMEERLQLMELLFKSYYINDEVFRHLDAAIKNKKNTEDQELDSNSSQTNEEIPMSQTQQLRRGDSFIDAPIKSDDAV